MRSRQHKAKGHNNHAEPEHGHFKSGFAVHRASPVHRFIAHILDGHNAQ